jgi:ribosomal protein S21
MSKVVNVQVDIRETRGDVNKLIRKFIKKCKKERIIEDYLDRRFYEKPSQKRRRKKLKKKENARKAAAALRNKDNYNKR